MIGGTPLINVYTTNSISVNSIYRIEQFSRSVQQIYFQTNRGKQNILVAYYNMLVSLNKKS